MGEAMKWQRSGDTAMRCDPWTIAKVRIKGQMVYELWHDKFPAVVGRFDNFDAAKADAEQREMAGQG